jgi:hypothetical protein
MTTMHGIERMKERVGRIGLPEDKYLQVMARSIAASRASEGGTLAAMVMLLDKSYRVVTSDGRESKGDQVWAVCRDGDFVTVMLRNHTQPVTAQKMRVDRLAYVH